MIWAERLKSQRRLNVTRIQNPFLWPNPEWWWMTKQFTNWKLERICWGIHKWTKKNTWSRLLSRHISRCVRTSISRTNKLCNLCGPVLRLGFGFVGSKQNSTQSTFGQYNNVPFVSLGPCNSRIQYWFVVVKPNGGADHFSLLAITKNYRNVQHPNSERLDSLGSPQAFEIFIEQPIERAKQAKVENVFKNLLATKLCRWVLCWLGLN